MNCSPDLRTLQGLAILSLIQFAHPKTLGQESVASFKAVRVIKTDSWCIFCTNGSSVSLDTWQAPFHCRCVWRCAIVLMAIDQDTS